MRLHAMSPSVATTKAPHDESDETGGKQVLQIGRVETRSAARVSWRNDDPRAGTERATRRVSASQFVRRTQPCDSVWPIVDGSGVP